MKQRSRSEGILRNRSAPYGRVWRRRLGIRLFQRPMVGNSVFESQDPSLSVGNYMSAMKSDMRTAEREIVYLSYSNHRRSQEHCPGV